MRQMIGGSDLLQKKNVREIGSSRWLQVPRSYQLKDDKMVAKLMRDGVITEAGPCREFVTPKLINARCGALPHFIREQRVLTNGRIIVAGGKVRHGAQRRADYLLYYRRDYPLGVVEAKEVGLSAASGVQQAREYLQSEAAAPKAKHVVIRGANATLLSETLARVFGGSE